MRPNVNWRNIMTRAGWTFIQGALGTTFVIPYITDKPGWKTLGAGAAAGGIAAMVSFLKTLAQESLSPSAEPVPVARHEVPIVEVHQDDEQ